MRFGAKGLMSTLMRVRISSDAPRCTVQFGALDPRCTMVQVHGDPNEPSLGAGAAVAPCVTLDGARAGVRGVGGVSGEGRAPARADACIQAPSPPSPPALSRVEISNSAHPHDENQSCTRHSHCDSAGPRTDGLGVCCGDNRTSPGACVLVVS